MTCGKPAVIILTGGRSLLWLQRSHKVRNLCFDVNFALTLPG
jgi:hypothetical protein